MWMTENLSNLFYKNLKNALCTCFWNSNFRFASHSWVKYEKLLPVPDFDEVALAFIVITPTQELYIYIYWNFEFFCRTIHSDTEIDGTNI